MCWKRDYRCFGDRQRSWLEEGSLTSVVSSQANTQHLIMTGGAAAVFHQSLAGFVPRLKLAGLRGNPPIKSIPVAGETDLNPSESQRLVNHLCSLSFSGSSVFTSVGLVQIKAPKSGAIDHSDSFISMPDYQSI